MCGSSPSLRGVAIPAQNKDVCQDCDTAMWLHNETGIHVKFCKGCKNFRNVILFADQVPLDMNKDLPSKCNKCRERSRRSYLVRKTGDDLPGGTGGGGGGGEKKSNLEDSSERIAAATIKSGRPEHQTIRNRNTGGLVGAAIERRPGGSARPRSVSIDSSPYYASFSALSAISLSTSPSLSSAPSSSSSSISMIPEYNFSRGPFSENGGTAKRPRASSFAEVLTDAAAHTELGSRRPRAASFAEVLTDAAAKVGGFGMPPRRPSESTLVGIAAYSPRAAEAAETLLASSSGTHQSSTTKSSTDIFDVQQCHSLGATVSAASSLLGLAKTPPRGTTIAEGTLSGSIKN